MVGDGGAIFAKVGQLAVAEVGVKRSVADWVQGHGVPSAARLGHGMMLLDLAAKRAVAQPAGVAQPVQAPVRLPDDFAVMVMLPIGVFMTMRFWLWKVVAV